jgi:hypothetical protein
MVVRGAEGKADLLAEDMVVIVEDAYAPLTAVAMGPEVVIPELQQIEVIRWRRQTFRNGTQFELGLAEVKSGIQVAAQHFQITIGVAVIASHLADQKEIGLAEVGSKLLIDPQKLRPVS